MAERSGAAPSSAGMAAGASGAAVALVASAIVHTLAPRVPFPPIAVAEAVVRWTPGAVATFFIDRLGHVALPLAVFVTTAGFFALSMALGSLLPRPAAHLRGGSARVAALLGAPPYLLAILVMLPDSQTVGRVAYAAFLFPVFVVAVWVTARRFDRLAGDEASRAVVVDRARRDVIRSLGTGGVGLLLGWSGIGRLFFRSPDPGRLPLRVHGVSPAALPTMAPGDSAFDSIPDLAPEVTSNEDFYVVDAEIIDPDIDADTWALSVGGLVDRPYLLTYDELLDLPAVERFVTMECISNQVGGHLISTAKWTGIPLRDLLLRAGVHDGAAEVVARAVGGYSDSVSIWQAMLPTTLVAIGMNGQTLPRAHGFPARLLVPGLYGMKQPKWLETIELVDRPHTGYWEQRGWWKAAVVRTMSRIDTVVHRGGGLLVAGVAFGGDRGISRVEVSTDGGVTWHEAELRTPLSRFTWRLWRFPFDPSEEGPVEVLARATDGEGHLQVMQVAPPHPSGATGYDSIAVEGARPPR